MKVLLLGDWSAVHKYLKEGLLRNGVEATLLAEQNMWKFGGADDVLYDMCWTISDRDEKRKRIIQRQQEIGDLAKKYDIVQLMSPSILCYSGCERLCQDIKSNARFFTLASGWDFFYYRAWRGGKYRYSMHDTMAMTDINYSRFNPKHEYLANAEEYITSQIDGIIPLLYEYKEAYREHPKCRKTICMPVNTDYITYKENVLRNKIVFSHGYTDRLLKGTKYIQEAMRIVQEKYPHDVECRITAPVPFDQYLEDITEANVIVDQCFSYGYGMGACHSMARGRIVMSGAEPETLESLSLESSPVINILPKVEDIVAKMERIIEERNQIPQWGYDSRQHIERYHNYVDIAQKFMDCWAE